MALVLNDRVRETTTIVGTGTATLLGAAAGYQSFSVIGNANTCYYTISDQAGTNWEVGIGTYVSATPALARTTVLKSSNSNNLVSFPAGTKDVFVTYPAETAVSGGGGGTYPTIQPSLNLDFANTKQLDPRITFVRNSTATYYDGQTTAMAEQNLLLQSQTFATTWVTSNTTLGSLITAPDGTTTAYPLTASAINGTLLQTFTATANAYTFSIYIQRVTGTGNIDITVDGTTYATQTTTGTWTRFNITTTPSAGSKTAGIRLAVSGDVVNIWGAQLEQRSSATAYTPTTTAAITNYIPQLMTAPAGVARFDCDPITGKSLGLLIEESRVNLLTYSSDFSNAVWVKSNSTVTSAANVAPDGAQTGNQLIENTANSEHRLRVVSITKTSNQVLTYSVYVKPNGRYTQLSMEYSGVGLNTIFDVLNNQYIDIVAAAGWTRGQSAITSVGNGWYRCIISGTTDTNLLVNVRITLASTYSTTINQVYTGDGYSGIYIWGAQLEAGSFATSFIPTVATTITRAADNASITGTNFSSWYNQAQGSMYAEIDTINSYVGSTVFRISDGSGNNRIALGSYIGNASRYIMVTSGANPFISVFGTPVAQVKLAVTFIVGNYLQAFNGTYTTASTSILPLPLVNKLDIGTELNNNTWLNGHIRKLSYYPVALSSANLVALTS